MGGFPLGEALARQARDQARRPALLSEDEGTGITFGQLPDRIAAWMGALRRLGADTGGLVALAVGNRLAFVETFFALRAMGAPVLLLDEDLKPAAAREVCRRMGAGRIVHRDPDLEGEPLPGVPDPSVRYTRIGPAQAPPAGTAVVKLTSGSTLNPRGACLTEEALREGIDHIVRGMELTPRDRVLISIPLSHSYGFDNGVLSLAVAGTLLVLQPDLMPAAIVSTLRDREVTFFPAVPAILRALGQIAWQGPFRLRSVICASAPLSPEAASGFSARAGLRVRQFYGATECGGISFETDPGDPRAQGCVGLPLPGVRIALTEEGAVRVYSRANRFAVIPEEPVPPYVETGDRAEFTPEGRLRLLGRTRLVANIGGIKVDLGAIDAFLRSVPGVADAASLAVADPARGQRIVAYVETSAHSTEGILQACRRRLSAREIPSEIRILERLPRTPRGKLDRTALLEEAEA